MKKVVNKSLAAGLAVLGLSAVAAQADQVFLDDVIVDGSLCVGQDCVNGESFGFDTIRLKENNLRINFTDTSNSASFPTTDWTIQVNDSANGGNNKFAVQDIDSGLTPFQIRGGAPANSLFVASSGNVGFGTNSPVADLHVKSGNTPTLRLEQDGSSGFAAQTFDVASNETNFFIRDVSNGSTLPFRIEPGASTNALYIEDTDDVGFGTSAPEAPIHILRSGAVNIRFHDSAAGVKWESGIASNDTFKISAVDTSGVQFRFTREGGMVLQPQDAAPVVSLGNGMIYYDDSGALCARVSGAWVALAGAGDCL
ncbi:hypothetical protein [Pelagimonas varians]|uniref:Uncharacterized protein n=1 Tax=Pelagimonas varians TaxID=696760 RepID=A0A238L142_9RHOB|nr:hypothetical protein [Pelagimonas varians]PYG27160.1 hypothetical protein C8N36_1176 [Pelagimonas varians]SMX48648.1 hypothetical protein PEV8663_03882 [Pelagimonas varians]